MTWFLYEVAMQAIIIAVHVTNSTRPPYLDITSTRITMDFTTDGWFYSRSAFTSVICVNGSVISPRPEWVLRCLSITFSLIPRADRVILISTKNIINENIISRDRISAQISAISWWIQNIMRICVRKKRSVISTSVYRIFIRCHIFVLHISVTATSNCR